AFTAPAEVLVSAEAVTTALAVAAGAAAGGELAAPASPAAKISAIVLPTGTTSPAWALTSRRMPDAGASISTVTLSVSISTIDSPLATRSPGDLIQRRTLPVSCAISSAGMMTFVGIGLGDSSAHPGPELGRGGREADPGRVRHARAQGLDER